jgi:hypothetical protein
MLRLFFILAFFGISISSASWAANWNSGSDSSSGQGKGRALSENFFVPKDIADLVSRATPKTRLKHCGSPNGNIYENISKLAKKPPMWIKGYNSRMDNVDQTEGGREATTFVLLMSEAMSDAWAKQEPSKQEILLDALHDWASADALTKTKKCRQNKKRVNSCTMWKQTDGQDLSDSKDHTTTQQQVMFLAYGYFATLAEFKKDDPRHLVIRNWISKFFSGNLNPNSKAKGFQAFGFGYRFPTLLEFALADQNNNSSKANKMMSEGLDLANRLIFDDGSISGGTYRGNKGLSYHHSSMAAVVTALEVARKLGVKPPAGLEEKIERAGEVFIRGFNDHSYLDQWAKKADQGVYTPGRQDFYKTMNIPNGNSWFYIYSLRYPESQITQQLDKMLSPHVGNGRKDGWLGFGLGCMYAVAKEVRYPNSVIGASSPVKEISEAPLAVEKTSLVKGVSRPPIKFQSAKSKMYSDKDNFMGFRITIDGIEGNRKIKVMVDFDDKAQKESGDLRSLRLEMPAENFLDPAKTQAAFSCSKSTIKKKGDTLTAYRLYSGKEEENNECAFSTMTEAGRKEAESLLATLGQIFANDNVKKSDPYGVLEKHSQFLMKAGGN